MGQLMLTLVPVALGVVLSPLALMALVAVLLSQDARVNGIAYLLGWLTGLGGLLVLFLWLFATFSVHEFREPPLWVPLVRLALGALLCVTAWWVYRRGHDRLKQMASASSPRGVVAAAPQLPGWLREVATFRPTRTFFLGLALFVVNPVDASCAVIAALDISLADVSSQSAAWVAVGFVVIGALPIAVPVLYVVARGESAQPLLDRTRGWVASNTHVLNAALLLVIGVIQLQKGLAALL